MFVLGESKLCAYLYLGALVLYIVREKYTGVEWVCLELWAFTIAAIKLFKIISASASKQIITCPLRTGVKEVGYVINCLNIGKLKKKSNNLVTLPSFFNSGELTVNNI